MYNIRHKKEDRAKLDYYSTDPNSVRALLAVEKFNTNISEPVGGVCGRLCLVYLAQRLKNRANIALAKLKR